MDMGGQMVSLLIIGYLLFLFPFLLGNRIMRGEKKEADACYLYGMAFSLALFFLGAYVFDYLELALSRLAYAYAALVILLSIPAVMGMIAQKAEIKFSRVWLLPYAVVSALTVVFILLRLDTSTDSVLESALTDLTGNRISGLSPYTGEEMTTVFPVGFLPAYYACLSKLSGLQVAVIGKAVMPLAVIFMALASWRQLIGGFCGQKKERISRCLWGLVYVWIFFCFDKIIGFRLLWEAPWTPECLIWICFLPAGLSFFMKKTWERRDSLFLAALLLDIGFSFDIRMAQNIRPVLFVLLILLIVWLIFLIVKGKRIRNKKTVLYEKEMQARREKRHRLIRAAAAVLLAVLSVAGGGCIVTDSAYAVPDNRCKMDREVMEIRIMAEELGSIKMLAPPEVAAQIRDADGKVTLLLGPDTELVSGAYGDVRLGEIAKDLRLHEYEPLKLIQHARAEGCNVVVSYCDPGEEAEQEELFLSYGFVKLGKTDSYAVYTEKL